MLEAGHIDLRDALRLPESMGNQITMFDQAANVPLGNLPAGGQIADRVEVTGVEPSAFVVHFVLLCQ